MTPKSNKILVTDFDGTMTANDFYMLALKRLPPEAAGYWTLYEKGKLSHFNALAAIFALLKVDETEFSTLLEEMLLEKDIETALADLASAGWQVEIASAGCCCYIERLLATRGIVIPVHANPGIFKPSQGLFMKFPEKGAYYSPETGVDKAGIVRTLLAQGVDVAYAGDGRPDLAPVLLLPSSRRFARGWLAAELTRRNEKFTGFRSWYEIAATLVGESLCRTAQQ